MPLVCLSLLSLCLCGESHLHLCCIFGDFLPHIRCDSTDICDAADIRESSAANAPFQRHQPSQPPAQNVDSAASPVLPACHFSGSIANSAFSELLTALDQPYRFR